jgi:hypothetical protein
MAASYKRRHCGAIFQDETVCFMMTIGSAFEWLKLLAHLPRLRKTIMATTTHDPDARYEPALAAPPLACDAHFHVFGAAEKYPYGTDIRYKPPYKPLEAYLKLADNPAHLFGFQ